MAGPFGLSYFLLLFRMDASRKHGRDLLKIAYAHSQKPAGLRRESFHLSWTFDAVVFASFLIAVVGFLTA